METPLGQQLDRHQPVHFIGVGGIGMSAIAGILADRGYAVSGSDPRDNAVLQDLRSRGVRVFREQSAATINAIRSGTSTPPLVVVSSAVPADNPELEEARRSGLQVLHRSDVLAALIADQRSVAVAGSHGKTTTSTLIASLLHLCRRSTPSIRAHYLHTRGADRLHPRAQMHLYTARLQGGHEARAHTCVVRRQDGACRRKQGKLRCRNAQRFALGKELRRVALAVEDEREAWRRQRAGRRWGGSRRCGEQRRNDLLA